MPLSLCELDQVVIELISDNAKGRGRNCARNAIHHLEMAWTIKDIDPEMALFRSITAEEEAATAIFLILKEKGYENANKIKFKSHPYKQALNPFIQAISKFVADTSNLPAFPFGDNLHLSIKGEGNNRRLKLSFSFLDGLISAIPPLGFEVKLNDKPYYFDKELLEITTGESRKDIIKHIEKIANLRNELLYARPEGIPRFSGNIEKVLEKRQNVVIALLRMFSLIFPYEEKALFVQQALNAFLRMMGDIEQTIEEA